MKKQIKSIRCKNINLEILENVKLNYLRIKL